ncbi:MAG: SET domain-containing protein-lysine N-methyltransferase [Bacteroidota bacterium]
MKKNNGYKLLKTSDKGDGVYATKQFLRHDIVMVGSIKEDNIEKNHSHASQMGEFRHAMHAGLISKVNHSCDPNCGIKLNTTGAHDFVAMKEIRVGDEITFDYAMRNYNIEYFPKKCCCGSENCRGTITGWKDLPDSFKSDYSGFVAPYLLEMDCKAKAFTPKQIELIK